MTHFNSNKELYVYKSFSGFLYHGFNNLSSTYELLHTAIIFRFFWLKNPNHFYFKTYGLEFSTCLISDPAFPTLPDAFSTRLEANLKDLGETITAEIYYDYGRNFATVKQTSNGGQTTTLLDYNNNQMLTVDTGE